MIQAKPQWRRINSVNGVLFLNFWVNIYKITNKKTLIKSIKNRIFKKRGIKKRKKMKKRLAKVRDRWYYRWALDERAQGHWKLNSKHVNKDRKKERVKKTWNCLKIEKDNGEFDPGSGWTLAACLIHASRTQCFGIEWRTGE